MQIAYEDYVCLRFIEEINDQENVYKRRPDLVTKARILQEIEKAGKLVDAQLKLSDNELERQSLIDDYQEFEAKQWIEYYNDLTSCFQKIYAIFENQTSIGKKINFEEYPIIKTFNDVVNVTKHHYGRSLKALQDADSKFLHAEGLFPPATHYLYSGILMNLDMQDLFDFCEEVKKAWYDVIKDQKEKRLEKGMEF